MAKIENKLKILQLKNLRINNKNEVLRDGGGLRGRVRVTSNGNVSVDFSYQYRFGCKRREKRCGTWPDKDLPQIRAERDRFRQMVKSGVDPIEVINEQKNRISQEGEDSSSSFSIENRLTVTKLFYKWKDSQLSFRKDLGASVERSFMKDVFPAIGEQEASEITRQQISEILYGILERGSNRMANIVLTDLRQLFGYAIGAGLLENDPTSRLTKASFGGKETPRERVLSEKEIIQLFQVSLPNSSLLKQYQAAIPFILGTLVRVGELLKAKLSDFDMDQRVWQIPKEHSKNNNAHIVHLSYFSMYFLKQILFYRKVDSNWLFPSHDGSTHVCVKTLSKQIGDRQKSGSAFSGRTKEITSLQISNEKWTPHDLRRTGATLMGNLGVRPDIIEKCLNHLDDNKIRATYQRQELLSERRQAFDSLGNYLSKLIGLNLRSEQGVVSKLGDESAVNLDFKHDNELCETSAELDNIKVTVSDVKRIFRLNKTNTEIPPLIRYALEFIILTAVSVDEFSGLSWSEFIWKEKLWVIPKTRSSTKEENCIPLNDKVLEVLVLLSYENLSSNNLVFPDAVENLNDTIAYLYEVNSISTPVFLIEDIRRCLYREHAEIAEFKDVLDTSISQTRNCPKSEVMKRKLLLEKKKRLLNTWTSSFYSSVPSNAEFLASYRSEIPENKLKKILGGKTLESWLDERHKKLIAFIDCHGKTKYVQVKSKKQFLFEKKNS